VKYDLADLKTPDLPDHYRPRRSAALWQSAPIDWRIRLIDSLERSLTNHAPAVYFRADGIGAGGCAFDAVCKLFRTFEIPLAMAVVPSWLSDIRKRQLFASAPRSEQLWGWLQHGWRHVNWQRTGVRSEFGEHRPFEKQWRDIWQGQLKMQEVFEDHLLPVFTPPWNTMSGATLRVLKELRFKGISAFGSLHRGLKHSSSFKNIRIQLDLHARDGKDGGTDFENLLGEIQTLIGRKEPFGVMIQHHRMTAFAFQFLYELLYFLKYQARARFLSFKEMLEAEDEK
jgi:hypothetical protein